MRTYSRLSIALGIVGITLALAPSSSHSTCVGVQNCPCDVIADGSELIRSEVKTIDASNITLVANEILLSYPNQYVDIKVGETFGGTIDNLLPCDGEPWSFSAGDKVLALFKKGTQDEYPDCIEYRDCRTSKCDDLDRSPEWDECNEQCIVDTYETCSTHRGEALAGGIVVLLPDKEKLHLRSEQPEQFISSANITDLLDANGACNTHFPNPPEEPCYDTPSVPFSCSFLPDMSSSNLIFFLSIIL